MTRETDSNGARSSRIDWHRLERRVVAGLLLQAVASMSALALGWISFLMFLFTIMAEAVLVSVLTGLLYPERGRRRVTDAVKAVLACGFTGALIVPLYLAGAGAARQLAWSDRLVQGLDLTPGSLMVALALLMIRLGALWFHARSAPDPHYVWGRDALREGAVLMVSLVLACFASFVALLASPLLAFAFGARAADVAFGLMLVSITTGLSCLAGTMSEKELREMVGNPYVD